MLSTTREIAVPAMPALQLQRRYEARARRQRLARKAPLFAWIIPLAVVIAIAAWSRLRDGGTALLGLLDAHPFTTTMAAIAVAWVSVQQARRHSERAFAASWLVTAPLERRAVVAALRIEVATGLAPVFVVVLVLPAAAALASTSDALDVIVLIGAGLAVGALCGWRMGGHALPPGASQTTRLYRAHPHASTTVGLAALARWPFAQMLAQASPRTHARILAAVLLTMPMGIPPLVALLGILATATLIGIVALLRGLLEAIPDAAVWLRSTPLPYTYFVSALCLRASASLCAALLWMALLLYTLGSNVFAACMCAAAALTWIVTATGNALACRYRPAQARIERVALGTLLLAVAASAWPALFVVLPVIWLREWKRARNA